MPGKTRRKKGKFSSQSKRKPDRQNRPAAAIRQQEVAPVQEPASPSGVSASPASMPAPAAKPAAIRHPYIAAELWTIGILAVVMLAVLIVLATVLS